MFFFHSKKERSKERALGRRRLHAVLRSKDLHNLIHLCVLSFMCALWRETKGKNFCIEASTGYLIESIQCTCAVTSLYLNKKNQSRLIEMHPFYDVLLLQARVLGPCSLALGKGCLNAFSYNHSLLSQ